MVIAVINSIMKKNYNCQALELFLEDERFQRNIAVHRIEDKREAEWVDVPEHLHKDVKATLEESGIQKLYSHQGKAINGVLKGLNVVITTGVASGKSLCYQVPIMHTLAYNPQATALCIYPTKALTQDQNNSFNELLTTFSTITHNKYSTGIYDGDTPSEARRLIRKKANVLLTNPDMLHYGILPNHPMWVDFFANLKFIVIDEVHVYRGIFGSHFSNVLRRIKRLCNHYDSDPTFILTSATVGNTHSFISTLIEKLFLEVDHDGSPQGNRHFMIYNPPIVNQELGIRRSALKETSRIASLFTKKGVQSLVFAHSRKSVEMIVTNLQKKHDEKKLAGYRSGYLAEERRDIEKRLKSGKLNTVVTTNALELGIDIGDLDVVIMNGYAGTIASTKQQAGRAGRTGDDSLVILVANSNLIDQYLVKTPDYLFSNNPELALLDPDNTHILINHLKCALYEKPLSRTESYGALSRGLYSEIIEYFINKNIAIERKGILFWNKEKYPPGEVSLRTASSNNYLLLHEKKSIGTIDNSSAYWLAHPDAVYIHNGLPYFVQNFDIEKRVIELILHFDDYYTEAISQVEYEVRKELEEFSYNYGTLNFSIMNVHSKVVGFKKFKWDSREILDYGEVDLPETVLSTKGIFFTFTDEVEGFINGSGNSHKKNLYGPDWEQIRNAVRERDHHVCQNCGKFEASVKFDVHHIKPFKAFENVADANKMDNLITLCKQCHRLAEASVKIQSTMAGITYQLRNLIPLHLMCSGSDIHVSFEEKLDITGDKPTIIIYDTFPGGIGLAKQLLGDMDALFKMALESVEKCLCDDGCPACVGPIAENGVGSKEAVLKTLKHILAL